MRRVLAAMLILAPGVLAEDDRPLVARRLEDSDWVVRALAAKSVGDMKHANSIQWLRDRLPRESNEYVQAFILKSIQAFSLKDLGRVGGKDLVGAALKPLKAKSPYVRTQAASTLQHLTGRNLGEAAEAWEAWWKLEGDAFAFALPKESPGRDGAVAEVKTERGVTFEEVVYDARRRGLEVVFVLDQTSSMQPSIDAAKAQVLDLCEYIHLLVPRYRVGLVTYDDAVQLHFPLTRDYAALKRKLDGVRAVGGGDTPEGVDKAIAAALEEKTGWSKGARKVLTVIGDAPAHPEDVPAMLEMAAKAAKDGWTVNGIDVGARPLARFGGELGEAPFGPLAKAGNGVTVKAGGSELVQQMLILSLGDEHRKALSGFVEVVRKVREKPTPPKP